MPLPIIALIVVGCTWGYTITSGTAVELSIGVTFGIIAMLIGDRLPKD